MMICTIRERRAKKLNNAQVDLGSGVSIRYRWEIVDRFEAIDVKEACDKVFKLLSANSGFSVTIMKKNEDGSHDSGV